MSKYPPPPSPEFGRAFDDEFAIGPTEGTNQALFGRDVLRGLTQGIEEFVENREGRWRQFRTLGPVLLGSAMWIDDPRLIDALTQMKGGVCIIVKKQSRDHPRIETLRQVAERTPGIPIAAFGELTGLAPKFEGSPRVVGPYDRMNETVVPTIRALGYRSPLYGLYPPIIHAKLALLGHLWWHDEGPIGNVEDVIGFTPQRLWISSANFTRSSRRSLEFGMWTEEPALLEGAERFVVRLMAASEPIDAQSDDFDPELAPVEFDDDAMAEALLDMPRPSDDEEDD